MSIGNSSSSVAGIILAAGQSSRMGALKPLLPFGEQTVIESCINYLREGGADPIVVVVGYRGDDIRKHLNHTSVRFAVNPDPASAMSTSIAFGVRELRERSRATLITPVDFPAVPSAVVTAVIGEWTKGSRLVKPTCAGRGGHPILVDLSLRKELLDLDPTVGLKGLFEKYRAEISRVEVNSPYIAQDIDTWDDYCSLHFEVFGQKPPERAKLLPT